MKQSSPVQRLSQIARSFGPAPARRKRELLAAIASRPPRAPRELRLLHELLCFLRAYPDDGRVLGQVVELIGELRGWLRDADLDPASSVLADSGLPGAVHSNVYALPFLAALQRRFPGCFEIDWEALEEPDDLNNVLGLLVTSGECQGLDDIRLSMPQWFEAARPASMESDLAFLLSLFTSSALEPAARDVLFELCRVPVRFWLKEPGTARCELARPVGRLHYQRRPFEPERRSVAAIVRRPFGRKRRLPASGGRVLIDLARRALCARNLEIRILTYANERDVWLVDAGRGLQLAVMGVVPEYRDPLENHTCVLLLRNGVPIGYGPATVWLGCCELGLNLFPEMRTPEARTVYAQFMRTAYQVLGARTFFLSLYAMGQGNPAAIRTGVFWFYRKLGFSVTNPAVEALARAEEARMRADPAHRSDAATLRRLSRTEGILDLSGGECRPLDLGALGVAQTRWLARAFGSGRGASDRPRAEELCVRRAARWLGAPVPRRGAAGERRGWAMLAPLVCMLAERSSWSRADRRALLAIVRAKGAPTEIGIDRLLQADPRLRDALEVLARPS